MCVFFFSVEFGCAKPQQNLDLSDEAFVTSYFLVEQVTVMRFLKPTSDGENKSQKGEQKDVLGCPVGS